MIELLVVIAVLGVLATVVVLAVGGVTDRGAVSAKGADEKFNDLVGPGPSPLIPGVTLHLMPIPTTDPTPGPTPGPTPAVVYESEIQGLIDMSPTDFSLVGPGLAASLTPSASWQSGSLGSWVADQVDVFSDGSYVTAVLI